MDPASNELKKKSRALGNLRIKLETFQRAQETQVEHRFPHSAGIVPVPRGSRGPRSLYLRRNGDSFGFTLRHFIVYPPDSVTEHHDGRHAAVGAMLAPMDTIFVIHVTDRGPAKQAGLQKGDRLVAVNRVLVKDISYSQVVQLIANSPEYLHLLVVPKEEDVLQRFFAETAYNPVSNQEVYPDIPNNRQAAQQFLTQRLARRPAEFQVDAISWRSLQQPYLPNEFPGLQRIAYGRGQRSADDILYSEPRQRPNQQEIYAEIHPHDIGQRNKCRAVPQVPLYRKMGRRASEGSTLSDREQCEPPDYTGVNTGGAEDCNMKAIYKSNYLPEGAEMPGLNNYPNTAGCRLSLDVGRRESSSSLSSSIADGSKDSLTSFDSNSTVTGHETDDSAIMDRFRKSVQQKEEFLRMPSNTVEQALIHREFYGTPKKLEKPMWPPNETDSPPPPSRTTKPTHQNFLRVKHDIDNERDLVAPNQNGHHVGGGGAASTVPQQRGVTSPRERTMRNMEKIYEGEIAPGGYDSVENMVEDANYMDDRRIYPPGLQIVHKRAKDFESGRPLPEDDPTQNNRMNFSRSELARLSSKKLVPNVSERAHEYETRRDTSGTSTNSAPSVLKRIQRDSRSLDSSGSNASNASVNEVLFGFGKNLSGNVTISSGSKYLHCPPPADWQTGTKPTDTSGNEATKVRARSNSAESWVAALGGDRNQEGLKRISRQHAAIADRNKAKERNDATEIATSPISQQQQQQPNHHHPYAHLPPLIPEPVERIHLTPTVSITPAPSTVNKAIRPSQLDLEGPVRPVRHLRPPNANADSPVRRSISPAKEDKPVVVKRRPKNTNIADDERAMRRESYLKATEGGRMHIDSDLSDGGDVSPQTLRSAHRRWRPPYFPDDIQPLRKLFEDAASSLGGSASSSSASLDREKLSGSPSLLDKYAIIREGALHCKVLEIDGKRAADRSWRQVFVVLKGPKLFLYKDRHHQSPVGTSDALDQSLASGVDMRTSVVRVAEDYTKRKNVLRVSAVKPCRSEFLLQAESSEEFADWVKTLQEQVAASTDAELEPPNSKQQAVPQMVPASTTIQVQGSHLSPQLSKSKVTASRNRSPTGQSPVSKSRKPSQVAELSSTSPKSKTWRGRMAKQFRKFNQGGNSPSSPTAPEGSTFGIAIEDCLPSTTNEYLPRFVEVCTDIIDERGLQTVGIYRVPGNNASITALTEEVNRNYDDVPLEDPRWNDLHVVSSLLKSYFRKMADSLITNQMYPCFIKADKIENPKERMEELRRLVRSLPKHNYHTLKHIIMHLKRVADNCPVNRMEAKNLAIVFGPTIVRPEGENLESMVNHMTNQCKIVESLLTHAEWFFPENDTGDDLPAPSVSLPCGSEEFESGYNQALLLHNISKYEALKDPKEKNGALFSSIISAAQRKVKRKPHKASNSLHESKDEPISPTNLKVFPTQSFSTTDLKESTSSDSKLTEDIPTTVTDIEKKNKPTEKVPWFNYSTDKDDFHRRIQNFKQETEAMLQLPRKTEISVNNIGDTRVAGQLSSSASNVNQNTRLSMKPPDLQLLTKTHSASNVFARAVNTDRARNSLNSMDNNNSFSVQFNSKNSSDKRDQNLQYLGVNNKQFLNEGSSDSNRTGKTSASGDTYKKIGYSDITDGNVSDKRMVTCNIRRVNSVENINSSSIDISNGNLKKVKYESENESQRTGSLDSLNKLPNDDESLLSTMTKLIDQKLKEELPQPATLADDIPFVDESPEKQQPSKKSYSDKENIPQASDLYRNPSLHKGQFGGSKLHNNKEVKEFKEKEKEEDTMAIENVPDNDRQVSKPMLFSNSNKLNQSATSSKLRRSGSLNKPERTVSPLNGKVKRSESLNKAGDKLKRSDSLSKTEKTECNNNKRRELSLSSRRFKDSTKNKRKNGMPDRSIKRRHTVGGTKDPDKVCLLMGNKKQDQSGTDSVHIKEKTLRTSSPDLSSARRDRFFFEINLIGPENMVVALRQHLIGARPQSFPESTVFKVPLESHV